MGAIGIIGAMDEEIAIYLSMMGEARQKTKAGFLFNAGNMCGKRVVVVKSGAGKVNAGACAQALIDGFAPSCIIVTGVAGALNPALDLTHVVISKESVQHDVDASALGFEKGKIAFSNHKHFEASSHLVGLASKAARDLGLASIEGRVLSGDQFISDRSAQARLRADFGGDCVDMESAAIAHVCMLNGVPHVIIRSMSDRADSTASHDFAATCKAAAENSARLVAGIISGLDIEGNGEGVEAIKTKVRTIPHWPKQGVMFRDVTTLIKDKEGFKGMLDLLAERYVGRNIDSVAGIEARGFIIGAALADRLGAGFIPIRKAGKLPSKSISEKYSLEYGEATIEVHSDAVSKGERVLLVDDLIATGGTALGACRLIDRLGGKVEECCFLINLPELGGLEKIKNAGYRTFHLMEFEGE